jgi:hypothetical protein
LSIATKLRTALRGDVSFVTLVREMLRRHRASADRKSERRSLAHRALTPARLRPKYAADTPGELLEHFSGRHDAFFTSRDIAETARQHFPTETAKLIATADLIVNESKWELAGFGTLQFTGDNRWRRDPLGTKDWALDYHADVVLFSNDGADIRVLWELNRFGHAIPLACAFALTDDERYAATFFAQIESWIEQNPYGRGANWQCAMEAALRSINLLAAFDLVRRSSALTEKRLALMLQVFDQHGRFIFDNNEFSYLATSNHYLSDVVGLFWIGAVLPELEKAKEWREFGLCEILREFDKQVLPDGADFEASTGYHKFIAEMLMFTFLLAQKNGIEIEQRYWEKVRSMFDYLNGTMRPDGQMPLIGDADGSQIVPVVKHESNDTAYLLGLAAVVFGEPRFCEFGESSPEMLLLLGESAVKKFGSMEMPAALAGSAAFPDAGAYVLRKGDLYLQFNANDAGVNGRGSHAHNDALSIEVSAFGSAFIIDPGSYVYNLDRDARQRFRSTAYHSTVMIDGEEQNTTVSEMPFVLGDEAKPKVLEWQTTGARDAVAAEHYGYTRLPDAVTHRRTVSFDKVQRYWTVVDELSGAARHEVRCSFHLAPGILVKGAEDVAIVTDEAGCGLLIKSSLAGDHETLPAAASTNYGDLAPSPMLVWRASVAFPLRVQTLIFPFGGVEEVHAGLELLVRLADNNLS